MSKGKATDEKIDIARTKVARGERRKLKLPLLELADGSTVELPVMIVRGQDPGPVCYVGSAFHGDEINGVEIVARLARETDTRDLRGTLIIVPAQNPLALQVQHRYPVGHLMKSPLDQSPADPWVCFPGHAEGNMATLMAHRIYDELMSHADIMIDIHTPTTGGCYAPFAFLPPTHAGATVAESEKLAKAFGADYVLASDKGVYVQDTSPHVVMAKAGKIAMGLEIGEGGKVDPAVTERGFAGLLNMLRGVGMLKVERPVTGRKLVISDMTPVRAHRGGLMHRIVGLNDDVKKGQVVAKIIDLFGEVVEEIKAPHDGPIVRIATFPIVSAGERVVQLGVPR